LRVALATIESGIIHQAFATMHLLEQRGSVFARMRDALHLANPDRVRHIRLDRGHQLTNLLTILQHRFNAHAGRITFIESVLQGRNAFTRRWRSRFPKRTGGLLQRANREAEQDFVLLAGQFLAKRPHDCQMRLEDDEHLVVAQQVRDRLQRLP
jgi:hypothetical protein